MKALDPTGAYALRPERDDSLSACRTPVKMVDPQAIVRVKSAQALRSGAPRGSAPYAAAYETLFKKRPSVGAQVIYAVGDIHGRFDLLAKLLRMIDADIGKQRGHRPVTLVFLGDYIDRGPSSRRVIQTLIDISRLRDTKIVTLKGNHEAAMLAFLKDPSGSSSWLRWGGKETLKSYGVRVLPPEKLNVDALRYICAKLSASLPPEHLAFLSSLETSFDVGDYVFVHAGVRPGVAWEHQTESDILWIRDEFLDSKYDFGKTVVHGHSIEDRPYRDHRRIGLDTGAYETGILTAARLAGGTVRFLQAREAAESDG